MKNKRKIEKDWGLSPATIAISVSVVAAMAATTAWILRRRRHSKAASWDTQFAGNYPRNEGAISAVTGGPPEDMNAMPATPSKEGPIWDGSQLSAEA